MLVYKMIRKKMQAVKFLKKGYEGVSWELSILQWSRVQEAWEALLAKAVLSGFGMIEWGLRYL